MTSSWACIKYDVKHFIALLMTMVSAASTSPGYKNAAVDASDAVMKLLDGELSRFYFHAQASGMKEDSVRRLRRRSQ